MKKILRILTVLILLCCILPMHASADSISQQVIVTPQYEDAGNFSDGYAPVKLNGKWGYINESGAMVIQPRYDWAGTCSEGVALVGVLANSGAESCQMYLLDMSGNAIALMDPIGGASPLEMSCGSLAYNGADWYCSDGIVNVGGFPFDTNGSPIEPKNPNVLTNWDPDSYWYPYEQAGPCEDGLIPMCASFDWSDSQYFYMDTNGTIVQTFPLSDWDTGESGINALLARDGDRILVSEQEIEGNYYNARIGVMDSKGNWVIEPEYSNYYVLNERDFVSEGLIVLADQNYNWGAFDTQGNVVLPFEYDSLGMFRNGLAPAEKDFDGGFVDTKGNFYPIAPIGSASAYISACSVFNESNIAAVYDWYREVCYCVNAAPDDGMMQIVEGSERLPLTAYYPQSDGENAYGVFQAPDGIIKIQEGGQYGFVKLVMDISEPHIHQFSDWKVSVAATPIRNGEDIRTCACGKVETRVTEADERLFITAGDPSIGQYSLTELAQMFSCVDWDMKAEYVSAPQTTAPYAAGRLTDKCLNNLIAQVNFARSLAHLEPVTLNEEYVTLAQSGTVLNAASGFSHYPAKPDDMDEAFYQVASEGTSSCNIAWGYSLMGSVLGYLDDSDASNVDRVGHRCWVLNPAMGSTGFGYTSSFSAFYAFDGSNGDAQFDFTAWPGGNEAFPSELMDRYQAWSVHLNYDVFEASAEGDVHVTLTRQSDGKKWEFSEVVEDTYSDYYFNLSGGYGSVRTIIFRPDIEEDYSGKYTVRVTGLTTTSGKDATIEYTVDFQSLLPFDDISESKFYYTPVLWAVENGITKGITATQFGPGTTCTRNQVVTFLWRAAGSPEPTSTHNPFTDVKSTDFCYKAVLWAVEKGITKGISATEFGPKQQCTRGQVATFLWRTLGQPTPDSSSHPFTDLKKDAFYYDAVLWAVEKGVTKGMTATTFAPGDSCTRGQIVTFLYRALA